MKNLKLLTLSIIVLATTPTAWSQLRFDIHAGFGPGSSPQIAEILVKPPYLADEYLFRIAKVKPQVYAGIRAHLDLKAPFFTEFGVTYSRRSSQFDMKYTLPLGSREQYVSMIETEHILMFPASIGIRMGSFDVMNGFRVNAVVSKTTELSHLNGYYCSVSPFSFGWHMGVRYAISRSMIGIEHLGSFNRVCQATSVNGQSLEIRNVPGQFVLTFQYSL